MVDRNRRRTIIKSGVAALLSTPFILMGNKVSGSGNVAPPVISWKYVPLDPKQVAEKAYQLYPEGSCMYASFRAIVESVGEKIAQTDLQAAQPYLAFPFQMMKYGKGGVYDYGSLCGVLNGSAAAISLFVSDFSKGGNIIDELYRYYETEPLPVYIPKENHFKDLEKTVADSVLCHLSSARWCHEADSEVSSPRRKERCRRLTADLVAYAILLLNRYTADPACAFTGVIDSTKKCIDCHAPKGKQKDVSTRMNCNACHDDIDEKHPD